MKKILSILLCLVSLSCYAEKEITPTPLQAAIADTATTIIALNHGLVELNPIGVTGTIISKGVLLFYVNDRVDDKHQLKKGESSIWTGAAVNNALLILNANPIIAIGSGIITGVVIWNKN